MKRFLLVFLLLTGLGAARAQTARVQVIHNSADQAAAVVDVWLNQTLLLDNFAFRTASPFIDAPAGQQFTISIAGPNSQNPNNPIWSRNYTLQAGRKYILIAEGIVSASGYVPPTPFDIAVYDMAREQGIYPFFTDVLVHHGVTDAPTVDIFDAQSAPNPIRLVNNISYGNYAGYLSLIPRYYVLEVRDASGTNTVAAFEASLGNLQSSGAAITLLASGFLNPGNNSNGPAFGLWAALPTGGALVELPPVQTNTTARLQVIHNSADPRASVVDVYVNGARLLDNLAFRAATPFVDVPAVVELNIGIAPGNSSSVNDTLKNFRVTLQANKTYVAIASGLVDSADFAPNPDGRNLLLTLLAKQNIRESGTSSRFVDFVVVHGATDAPTVDVIARMTNVRRDFGGIDEADAIDGDEPALDGTSSTSGWWKRKIVNNAAYSDITDYKRLYATQYTLDVTPGNNNNTVVASFEADLSGLGGGAAVVFASGFLNPAANRNGAPFGLFAALPSGTVVELPRVQPTARLQVIHNAADPLASAVDVYINGNRALDDFAFRSATPFLTVPAEVVLNIGIAPATSVSVNDTIKNIPVVLENGKTYVAVANGVVNPVGFLPNPDGRSIGFTLLARDGIQESASSNSKVDFVVLHGSTDAPTVDVLARNVGRLVDNASYGDFTQYIRVPAERYLLDVTPGNDNTTIVASFVADLSSLRGSSAVVFASGFLNPAANQNGPAFGLFAALPGGAVVQLPAFTPPTTARLQVIHNAADPLAAAVDVYLNGTLALNDFGFRTATPYIDVPAGVPVNIGVAPGNSVSADDTLRNFVVTFEGGKAYVAIANGVVDPSGFAPNPDGRNIGLTLFAKAEARETSRNPGSVDVFAVHGSTDAPTVGIAALGLFLPRVSYGDISDYVSLRAGNNYLVVFTPFPRLSIVGVYKADLSGLGGNSAVVLASGFLNTGANQNGAPFGLMAVLPSGAVVELPRLFGSEAEAIAKSALGSAGTLETPTAYVLDQNYPNPFNPSTTIAYSIPEREFVSLKVYDILGTEVATLVNEVQSGGRYSITFNAAGLASGVYFYRIAAGNFTATKRFTLMK